MWCDLRPPGRAAGDVAKNPSLEHLEPTAETFTAAGCIARPSCVQSAAPEDRHNRYLSWGHAKHGAVSSYYTESLWLHTIGSAYEAALVRAHKNHARAHNASKIE